MAQQQGIPRGQVNRRWIKFNIKLALFHVWFPAFFYQLTAKLTITSRLSVGSRVFYLQTQVRASTK